VQGRALRGRKDAWRDDRPAGGVEERVWPVRAREVAAEEPEGTDHSLRARFVDRWSVGTA